jgi:hypothetical protein
MMIIGCDHGGESFFSHGAPANDSSLANLKRNAFKHAFANKQLLDDLMGNLGLLFQNPFP